jgi:hypothetical protein
MSASIAANFLVETRAKTQDNITSEHWEEVGRNPNDEPTRSERDHPHATCASHCAPKTNEATTQLGKPIEPRPRPSTTQHIHAETYTQYMLQEGHALKEWCMQHRHTDNMLLRRARPEACRNIGVMRATMSP